MTQSQQSSAPRSRKPGRPLPIRWWDGQIVMARVTWIERDTWGIFATERRAWYPSKVEDGMPFGVSKGGRLDMEQALFLMQFGA